MYASLSRFFLVPGSRSTFPEVDPDPAKWYGSNLIRIRNTGGNLNFCPLLWSDYKHGFGGKFGVQTDRVDKSAVGWEHHERVDKHVSQKGIHPSIYLSIYLSIHLSIYLSICLSVFWLIGGRWEHHQRVDKHVSQKGILSSIYLSIYISLSI